MAKRSLPFSQNLYPVPAAVLTFSPGRAAVPFLSARWLGMTCGRPAVVSAAVGALDEALDGLRPGDLFCVHLPSEELLLKPDVRKALAVGGPGTFDPPADAIPGDLPSLAESPIRIECRYRNLRTLFDQRIIRGEVIAVELHGRRYVGEEALDLCRRHPFDPAPRGLSAAPEAGRAG